MKANDILKEFYINYSKAKKVIPQFENVPTNIVLPL